MNALVACAVDRWACERRPSGRGAAVRRVPGLALVEIGVAGTGKTSLLRDVAQVDAGPLERART